MHAPLTSNDPAQIGPYRLDSRIGRGGMGTVYLAEDPAGRRVAVKVINPGLAGDEGFQTRFRREVTAARRVRRFCTAAVLDADLDGDPVYVVTEYVEGPTLAEAVRERGPSHGGDLDSLAVGIATALAAIHGAGIVHRDLKPANVLLSPTGPRVIDFGIARALDAVDGPTRTGQFVGTPNYVAPEVLRGEEVTRAADVFSWGCVVAYAGTGRAPFAGSNVPAVLNRVLHEEPDLAGLDAALVDLVTAALAKDPAERPTAQELLARLTGSAPEAERTKVEGGTATAAASPRSRRKAPLVVAAVLLAVAALGAVGLSQLPDGSGRKPSAPPPKAGTAVFPKDDFAEDRGWASDGECGSYESETLEIAADEESGAEYCSLPDERSVTDGRTLHETTVAFRPGGSSGYAGLHVLSRNDRDRYEVLLRWDGALRLNKIVAGRPVRLPVGETALPGFQAGRANLLQVEVDLTGQATKLNAWVNRRPALSFEDTRKPLRRGTDALAVHPTGKGDSSELTCRFDDFSINRIF